MATGNYENYGHIPYFTGKSQARALDASQFTVVGRHLITVVVTIHLLNLTMNLQERFVDWSLKSPISPVLLLILKSTGQNDPHSQFVRVISQY